VAVTFLQKHRNVLQCSLVRSLTKTQWSTAMSVPQRLVALDFPTGLSLCPQNSPFQISPFKLYSHKTEPGEVLIDNSVAPLFWADGRERKCSKIYAVGHC